MIVWIILAVLILLLFVFFKAKHLQHRAMILVLLLLVTFFYLTFSQVIEGNNINLNTSEGLAVAGKIYFSWLTHIFDNARVVAGNVVKMNWAGNITG